MMTSKAISAAKLDKAKTDPADATIALDGHLTLCRVHRAWQRFGGPDKIVWDGVLIGQLDTGYTAHPAFGSGMGSWVRTKQARTFYGTALLGAAAGWQREPGHGLDPLTGLRD